MRQARSTSVATASSNGLTPSLRIASQGMSEVVGVATRLSQDVEAHADDQQVPAHVMGELAKSFGAPVRIAIGTHRTAPDLRQVQVSRDR
jgi:hypothetical protein